MSWRYATKKFDPSRKIDAETWETLKKALVLSPSSLGLQLWQFIDVQDAEIRKALREKSWGQSAITDASHLLVFCVRRDLTREDTERHLMNLCKVRGVPRSSMDDYAAKIDALTHSKSPEDLKAWLERQVYIALGVMILSTAVLGVDACPIEAMEPEAYEKLLGLEDSPYRPLCVLALGYRDNDPYAEQAKVRFPEEDVIKTVRS